MFQYREIFCKSALNRVQQMGFRWSLNPYQGCFHGCVYCFARYHAKLADRDAGEGFSSNVGVKVNVVEILRKEISSSHWKSEPVVIGTATDPYQPLEGKYKLTRGCLELLLKYKTPVQIITKGTMIFRDIELLVALSKVVPVTISFSVPTVDEVVWQHTEPGTPPPGQRLRVLRKLVEVGIEAGVGMAPILPGISDAPKQLEATVLAAKEAGACFLWGNVVYLKEGTREYFYQFLNREFPQLVHRYDTMYYGAFATSQVKNRVAALVSDLRKKYQVYDHRKTKLTPPPPPQQLSFMYL